MPVNDAYFSTAAIDALLTEINGSDEYYLGYGAVPTTRAAAISGSITAAAVTPTFQSIAAVTGPPAGRALAIDSKDFTANSSNTVAWVALCTATGTKLNYVQELSATQVVTSGQIWTVPAITVTLTDYDASA
jgi:folate-dependent tRNA-U54 methylase TrmFO/GidA